MGKTCAVLRILRCSLYSAETEKCICTPHRTERGCPAAGDGIRGRYEKDDTHEAHPEIEIEEVFLALFQEKECRQT